MKKLVFKVENEEPAGMNEAPVKPARMFEFDELFTLIFDSFREMSDVNVNCALSVGNDVLINRLAKAPANLHNSHDRPAKTIEEVDRVAKVECSLRLLKDVSLFGKEECALLIRLTDLPKIRLTDLPNGLLSEMRYRVAKFDPYVDSKDVYMKVRDLIEKLKEDFIFAKSASTSPSLT